MRAPGEYAGLTVKQADLLSHLRVRQAAGSTPSYEEMREAMGIASKSGIARLMSCLVERGYVERTHGGVRSLHARECRITPAEIGQIDLSRVPITSLLSELRRRVPAAVSHV